MIDFAVPSGRQVVVITGASAGIGRATAVAFGRRGWRVALIARGAERLESAAGEVRAAGGEALVLQADVADADAVSMAAARVVETWGAIEIWVNNAMATVFAPLERLSAAEIRRVTEVTYLGQVHGTLAALHHMRPRNRGTIVQIGSALGYRSIPLQSAYCAAKFAVRGFTDALRTELAHEASAIRLTMVQLPAVNTPQFDWARRHLDRHVQPVGRIYAPEAIAECIVDATEAPPRELWVGRTTLQAILGTIAAPGWMDRMMARTAWEGQMTAEPAAPEADGNLVVAPPGDPGSAGRFTGRSIPVARAISGRAARLLAALGVVGLVAAGAGIAGFALATS